MHTESLHEKVTQERDLSSEGAKKMSGRIEMAGAGIELEGE